MEKATISQLKDQLSMYLKKVRAGHVVLILDRDQPIARIERVKEEAAGDDRLLRLERAGLVRRSTAPLALAALRRKAPKSRRPVTQALLDERREGR